MSLTDETAVCNGVVQTNDECAGSDCNTHQTGRTATLCVRENDRPLADISFTPTRCFLFTAVQIDSSCHSRRDGAHLAILRFGAGVEPPNIYRGAGATSASRQQGGEHRQYRVSYSTCDGPLSPCNESLNDTLATHTIDTCKRRFNGASARSRIHRIHMATCTSYKP